MEKTSNVEHRTLNIELRTEPSALDALLANAFGVGRSTLSVGRLLRNPSR